MGGGSQTSKTESAPWKPIQGELSDAANQVQHGWRDAYAAGPTPTSPYMQQGWDAIAGQVNNQGSLLNNTLGLANNTVQGNYLSAGNPYFQQAYQGAADQATRAYSSAVDPAMRQYQSQMDQNLSQWKNAISPGIDAQFAAGGRLGSGLFANARNEGETNVARQFSDAQSNQAQYLADSNDALARNLTSTAGNMAYQNYGDERARQNAAMQQAPALSTLPGGILQQIGQQQMDAQNAQKQWSLNLGQQYVGGLAPLMGAGGTSTTKQPGQNPWLQALGLGLQGAAMFV
ncbi:hypothetical protein E9232_004896 [Inquilinus ginsengisoli]|uniref:Tail fiber domain-containing protein n=1 Tax=Inquilinus ginsengisoli TaxID=363840 RepID=A0ABU1JUQ9_9PROT|nr:hypothetical protein [Inquilinus ginsengisoli]MDR6292356.1 hypothetical protein [Inquilinus ginsengisoli]